MSLDLDGADVSVTDLQGGRAVCVRSLTPALDGGGAELPPTTGIDYHLPVPGTGGYLVLSFSTALPEPLAGAMIELFDASPDRSGGSGAEPWRESAVGVPRASCERPVCNNLVAIFAGNQLFGAPAAS